MAGNPIVHVGFQKTGSTWLQDRVFAESPGLFQVDRLDLIELLIDPGRFAFSEKEARDALLAPRKSDERVVVSHEWLVGHPFGNGYDTEVLAKRLAAVFGESVQVLIVIRRQEDMIRAHYGEWISHGGALSPRRFVGAPASWRWHPAFRYDYFEYDRAIRFYQAVFGADRVVVAAYERLKGDQSGFVDELRDRLDLPTLHIGNAASAHRSLSPTTLSVLRHSNRLLSRWGHNPAALLLAPGAHGRLTRALRKSEANAPDWLRKRVLTHDRTVRAIDDAAAGRYSESNRRTEQLTGLALGVLGYQL